jgi:hypothetical protein
VAGSEAGMTKDVQGKFQYGGLTLTCDESTFARLRNNICELAAVSAILGDSNAISQIRFITIRSASLNDDVTPSRPAWFLILLQTIAICLSGLATIIGFATIAQWLIQFFS